MPVPLSQNDLVNEMLNKTSEVGQEVTDKIFLPGLTKLFSKAPNSKKVKEKSLQFSELRKIPLLSKADLADIIVSIINDYSGILEINWHIEKPVIFVKFAEGWVQKRPEADFPAEHLLTVVLNLLKSRAGVRGLHWSLGSAFAEVTYLVL
jgi:hypothetical protein